MPPIRSIECGDHIKIVNSDGSVVERSNQALGVAIQGMSLERASTILTGILQQQYDLKFELSPSEKQGSSRHGENPSLMVWEERSDEGNKEYLIIHTMFIKAEVLSLSPLEILLHCRNKQLGAFE